MAAATISFIPVGEYLGSVYRPDMDYVEGALEERNVGEFDHGKIQRALLLALIQQEAGGNFYTIQEQRVQISATRYRVPDLCLLSNETLSSQIVITPPLLCVEVLSPRDTVSAMRMRSDDYLRMGVPEVWIFDGSTRSAYVLQGEDFRQCKEDMLTLGGSQIHVSLKKIFGVLDTPASR